MVLIKRTPPLLDWATRGAAVTVGLAGAAEAVAWLLHGMAIAGVLAAYTPRLNIGAAAMAAGAALWLVHTSAPETAPFRLGHALAVLAAMFGCATLARELSAFLGIAGLIGPNATVAVDASGSARALPAAEFGFLFAGAALFVLKSRDPRVAACSQWLALCTLALASLGVTGFVYGVAPLSALMAPHLAVALFVLPLAIMAADAKHGFIRIAGSDSAGGIVTRRLLIVMPAVLFALGCVELRGEAAGLFGVRFGVVAAMLLAIAICIAAVVSTAISLHSTDLIRKEAMARIRDLNARHERQIEERTDELAKSLAKLDAANKMLEQLSEHDGLTGVANRRYFDKYLDTQIAIARRHNRMLALIMCDVDGFKAYNDQYGHQAGDRCLKQVAAAIQSCCRRTADVVARYGGEEFAVILPETSLKGAMRVAELAREAVAQLNIPHGHAPGGACVSISGGVAATVWKGEATAHQLIAAADRMLYEAKRQGRNRMVSAPPVAA